LPNLVQVTGVAALTAAAALAAEAALAAIATAAKVCLHWRYAVLLTGESIERRFSVTGEQSPRLRAARSAKAAGVLLMAPGYPVIAGAAIGTTKKSIVPQRLCPVVEGLLPCASWPAWLLLTHCG
jgi:hypothetical protein